MSNKFAEKGLISKQLEGLSSREGWSSTRSWNKQVGNKTHRRHIGEESPREIDSGGTTFSRKGQDITSSSPTKWRTPFSSRVGNSAVACQCHCSTLALTSGSLNFCDPAKGTGFAGGGLLGCLLSTSSK